MIKNCIIASIISLVLANNIPSCHEPISKETTTSQSSAQAFITKETSKFGPFIEGVTVDPSGNIYATNFGDKDTTFQLGRLFPEQGQFYSGNKTAYLNGIRFKNSHTVYVADVKNHQILKLEKDSKSSELIKKVFCQHDGMLQPNDLALAKNGYVYATGMNYTKNTTPSDGDLWICSPSGEAIKSGPVSGRTNGIALSPKEDYLYVSESINVDSKPSSQLIFRYELDTPGKLSDKCLFLDAGKVGNSSDIDIDGMRTDIEGNLYVTRNGAGQVLVVSPNGALSSTIKTNFDGVTSLEFGGDNGKTLFIAGRCKGFDYGEGKGCVDKFENAISGAIWSNLNSSKSNVSSPYDQGTNSTTSCSKQHSGST